MDFDQNPHVNPYSREIPDQPLSVDFQWILWFSKPRRSLETPRHMGKRKIVHRIDFWSLEMRLRASCGWKIEKSIIKTRFPQNSHLAPDGSPEQPWSPL